MLPTDTVYGIAADAFSPDAVARLLAAKGRGRDMPAPVLVGSRAHARRPRRRPAGRRRGDLVEAFWPGALTARLPRSSRRCSWDLGDTRGTVAVRMPLHPVALEVLQRGRPDGRRPARTAPARRRPPTAPTRGEQLGDTVAVYLDGGTVAGERRLDRSSTSPDRCRGCCARDR